MKKDWLIFIAIIVVIFFAFKLLTKKPISAPVDPNKPIDIVLFWGDGCPHCENVRNYLKANPATGKLNIDQKEVYYNKANQQIMDETAKKCPEIDASKGLAVPMAYADNKCFVGDTPIIDLIKQKTAAL